MMPRGHRRLAWAATCALAVGEDWPGGNKAQHWPDALTEVPDCSSVCPVLGDYVNATADVLLIGDSIAAGFEADLADSLSALASVAYWPVGYAKEACGSSWGVLACLDTGGWLDRRWRAIHFNWGLHDIKPKTYAYVSPAQYALNIGDVLARLSAAVEPGGALIFATTTPVAYPYSARKRKNVDVLELNARAAAKLAELALDTLYEDDLYGTVEAACERRAGGCFLESCACDLYSDGLHFTPVGKTILGLQAAAVISQLLPPGEAPTATGDDGGASDPGYDRPFEESEDDDDCEDSTTLYHKLSSKDCDWVAENADARCGKTNHDGVVASSECPRTCGACGATPSPASNDT